MRARLSKDVAVREIRQEDIGDLQKYFFDSSPEFINSIGLKTPLPGAKEAFAQRWEEKFNDRENGGPKIPVLTVFYGEERIGFHPSTHDEPGQSLIMHAHFFREDLRGKGIGTVSYVLAVEKFLTEYGYKEVIFKTPKQNLAPMRIKRKLGLLPCGEEIIDWPVLVKPLPVEVYRVSAEDLPMLKDRAGLGESRLY